MSVWHLRILENDSPEKSCNLMFFFCWLSNVLESSAEMSMTRENHSRFCCRKRWWRCWWWQLVHIHIHTSFKSKSSISKSKSLIAVCTSSKKSIQCKMAVSHPSWRTCHTADHSQYNTSWTIQCYSSEKLVQMCTVKIKVDSVTNLPESKSSKNGLKSGLQSKSGLEYYKSGGNSPVGSPLPAYRHAFLYRLDVLIAQLPLCGLTAIFSRWTWVSWYQTVSILDLLELKTTTQLTASQYWRQLLNS